VNPVTALLADWHAAREALTALEAAEHPDIIDHHGRVWTWWKGDLYRHCGNAAPSHMIDWFGLPKDAVLSNPNYPKLCGICLNGRTQTAYRGLHTTEPMC
jgi:hypothetical protein